MNIGSQLLWTVIMIHFERVKDQCQNGIRFTELHYIIKSFSYHKVMNAKDIADIIEKKCAYFYITW